MGRAKGSTVKAAQLNLLLDNIRSGFIDIPIKEIKITTVFIEDFYLYIRNNTNSSMKFVQRFRIVLNYAKNSGLNFIVPFSNYKFNFYKVDRDYLDQKEIDMIYTKNLLYSTGE